MAGASLATAQAERRRRGLTARPNALSPSKSVALHVERNAGEIARLAREERDDALDRSLDLRRRRRLARVGISPLQPRAGPLGARFGKLHGDDAALAPCDAAGADAGIEKR